MTYADIMAAIKPTQPVEEPPTVPSSLPTTTAAPVSTFPTQSTGIAPITVRIAVLCRLPSHPILIQLSLLCQTSTNTAPEIRMESFKVSPNALRMCRDGSKGFINRKEKRSALRRQHHIHRQNSKACRAAHCTADSTAPRATQLHLRDVQEARPSKKSMSGTGKRKPSWKRHKIPNFSRINRFPIELKGNIVHDMRPKYPTGIPKGAMIRANPGDPGAMLGPDGYVIPKIDQYILRVFFFSSINLSFVVDNDCYPISNLHLKPNEDFYFNKKTKFALFSSEAVFRAAQL